MNGRAAAALLVVLHLAGQPCFAQSPVPTYEQSIQALAKVLDQIRAGKPSVSIALAYISIRLTMLERDQLEERKSRIRTLFRLGRSMDDVTYASARLRLAACIARVIRQVHLSVDSSNDP